MIKAAFANGIAAAAMCFAGAPALAARIDGSGSIATCPATGKINTRPALVTAGTEAGGVKLAVKSSGPCSGGTGDGANIVSFKARGAGTTTANTCMNFNGTSSTDIAATLQWKVAKGSPKLNASTATFSLHPGAAAGDGNQTLDLAGVITAGSFIGTQVTAHIESDDSAATLLSLCDDKGIKKITFGANEATSSCMNGPNLHAAITKQITTIDSNDVPHLQVEITTVTASPFKLTPAAITNYPANMVLESSSSSCYVLNGHYRCEHEMFFKSSGACRWDGNYRLPLTYSCSPTNTCDLCSGNTNVDFSLTSENFCTTTTVFCVPDLSCSEATGRSGGGVPCCGSTYPPFISCMSQHCATQCPYVVDASSGVNPDDDPCYACIFYYCHDQYFACAADNQQCFTP